MTTQNKKDAKPTTAKQATAKRTTSNSFDCGFLAGS
jgi:hypothetical protein